MSLSEILKYFIATHIDSVDQLEILLLLKRDGNRSWRAVEVSSALYTSSESAAACLAELSMRGLLQVTGNTEEKLYRYAPKPELAHAVSEIERLYPKYPVSIINSIFSKPKDRIRTFEHLDDEKRGAG
jgi:hypothetical protein